MTAPHNIENIIFKQDLLQLKINGKLISLPIEKLSRRLNTANDMQRNFFTISPSGYGIHWPLIDEDLSVASILKAAEYFNAD